MSMQRIRRLVSIALRPRGFVIAAVLMIIGSLLIK